MWDGREGRVDIGTADPASTLAKLVGELTQQAQDATLGHAQAMLPGLTVGQQNAIVQFELGLTSAQTTDLTVGRLNKAGGNGGAATLADESFHVGINDTLGQDPTGHPFNPVAFTLFSRWMSSSRTEAQRSVARGEALFNSKPIAITGVAGLNDDLSQATIQGSCTTCHNSPNVGNHSAPLPINIGVSDASRRTPDLPLYTLRNKATGQTVQTTDPGRALVTGKWADIGKVKGPVLRNLAARGPYFHNGSAATLGDVVDFYNTRFSIGLNAQERLDLVAFLRAL
jgi:hypothetical protein